MRHQRIVFALMLLLVVFSGCQSSATPTQTTSRTAEQSAVPSTTPTPSPTPSPIPTTSPAARGYVGSSDIDVIFLQWTETDHQLTGQIAWSQMLQFTDSPGTKETTSAITGVQNNDNVSLTFQQDGKPITLTGTVNGDHLVLTIANIEGGLRTVDLRTGTVNDYNRASQAMREQVTHQIATITAQVDAANATATAQASAAAATQDAQSNQVEGAYIERLNSASLSGQRCSVGVVTHPTTVTISGGGAQAWCEYLLESPTTNFETRQEPTDLKQACGFFHESQDPSTDAYVVVRDTTMQYEGDKSARHLRARWR